MCRLSKCLSTGCCAVILLVGCLTAEAQKHLLPGAGTTFAAQQIIPYTDNGDKSRLVQSVIAMNAQAERLYRYQQEVATQLLQITPLLTRPGYRDDLLDRLNRLDALLPRLETSLKGLGEVLSLFIERRMDVPYRVALYPTLRFQEDNDGSLLSLGVTYSDDTIALDITGQYLRLHPSDEGLALFAKHDMTPNRYAASRALQVLAAEVHRLSAPDLTRMITEVRQITEALTVLRASIAPVREQILQLKPLVEEYGHDPQRLEEFMEGYSNLVAPLGKSVGAVQEILGPRGEEFDNFFSRFRTTVQEARAALVRSALSPHFALTAGVRSFRRLGKASAAGFALAQQIPLAPESGILWNLSGQYVWLNPRDGQETSGTMWGLTVAWIDRLSSFNERGVAILRRWQWQVGIEYNPRGGLLDRSYGAFVRWRPTERLEDYLLFWMHEDSGQDTFGVGVRWMFGVERY